MTGIHQLFATNFAGGGGPIEVEYLCIAGGASAGSHGGAGGGAGGYRNSVSGETTGGGGTNETALVLGSGITYTITVGSNCTSQFAASVRLVSFVPLKG